MKTILKKRQERYYNAKESVSFRKTKNAYGGLSNMCSGYPLLINGHRIKSSEAIYQACRFPDFPEVQRLIINEASPMAAKMKSKPYREHTRVDWNEVRIPIMRWALEVKLAQNFIQFGQLLEETHRKPIVEDSRKDRFWGAIREKDNCDLLIGVNALGRLLMELREKYVSSTDRHNLLYVETPDIKNFKLFGDRIDPVDERERFGDRLLQDLRLDRHYHIHQTQHCSSQEFVDSNEVREDEMQGKKLKTSGDLSKDTKIIEGKIIKVLESSEPLTSKEISRLAELEWSPRQITNILRKMSNVNVLKSRPLKFQIKRPESQFSVFMG